MTLPDEDAASRRTFKPFLEHLQDLRTALIRSIAALAVGMAAAVPLAPHVVDVLKWPLTKAGKDPASFLKVFEVTGGFHVAAVVVILTGLLLSAPLIVFFIADFVFPGLTGRERSAVRRFGAAAVALFAGGVAMGYFLMLPVVLRVMFGIGEWVHVNTDFVAMADYMSFCLYFLLGFGLAFEAPVVFVMLGYLGLVSSAQLRAGRSWIIVAILIMAAALTPPDVFSQCVMAVPMILLFEASIWIIRLKERRDERADAAARPARREPA